MPPSGDITLTPKGKQGKEVTFTDILADGLVPAALFVGGDTFLSYSYGTKGKPKDKTIFGTGSDEYLVTGDGNDTIYMYGGSDIVVSGGGNDIINTGDGNDMVISGTGDDTIRAGTGSNYIDGGAGIDTYVMEPGYGGDVDLSAGTMTIGDATIDVLLNIEDVTGNDGDNVITGDGNINYIATGGGADTIYGGGGNDQIDASTQTGSKIFVGGTGDDTILAGVEADEFYWVSGDGADTVYYFDAGDGLTGDTLHLDLVGDQSLLTVQQLVDGGYLRISANPSGGTLIEVDVTGGADGAVFESAIVLADLTFDGSTISLLEGNITDDLLV